MSTGSGRGPVSPVQEPAGRAALKGLLIRLRKQQ